MSTESKMSCARILISVPLRPQLEPAHKAQKTETGKLSCLSPSVALALRPARRVRADTGISVHVREQAQDLVRPLFRGRRRLLQ